MSPSNWKPFWHQANGEKIDNDESEHEEEFLSEEMEQKIITRIQQRLGVSRERARNIVKNSKMM